LHYACQADSQVNVTAVLERYDDEVRANIADEPGIRKTLLAFDLANELPEMPPPNGVVIRPVADRAGLADIVTVGVRAFGEDCSSMVDEFVGRLAHGTASFYVAYSGEDAVGSARLELPRSGTFAGLFGGGTVPEHRSRGVYRALVAVRARAARERGFRYLAVDARDTSLPILSRLGFMPLTTVTAWTWQTEP
jgi:hypothetical protein